MAKKQTVPVAHLPELVVTLGHGAFIIERTQTGWIAAEVDAKNGSLIRSVVQDDQGAEFPAAASLSDALRSLFHEELLLEAFMAFGEDDDGPDEPFPDL